MSMVVVVYLTAALTTAWPPEMIGLHHHHLSTDDTNSHTLPIGRRRDTLFISRRRMTCMYTNNNMNILGHSRCPFLVVWRRHVHCHDNHHHQHRLTHWCTFKGIVACPISSLQIKNSPSWWSHDVVSYVNVIKLVSFPPFIKHDAYLLRWKEKCVMWL